MLFGFSFVLKVLIPIFNHIGKLALLHKPLIRLMWLLNEHIIEWLKIHVDTLWCFILLFLDSWRHSRPSQQLMNILIYEHDALLILTILLFNFFHKLVDLLPIEIIHVFRPNFNPCVFPICKLKIIIGFFLIWKPILFIKSKLLLENSFNIII
jgi:hypothetical protein